LGEFSDEEAEQAAQKAILALARVVVRRHPSRMDRTKIFDAVITQLGDLPPDELEPAIKNLIAILSTVTSTLIGYRATFEFLTDQADNVLQNANRAERK